tara:strand:+ start:549 stop:788 length:240 start_codon:yes stop_codon:yes gene_type:complete
MNKNVGALLIKSKHFGLIEEQKIISKISDKFTDEFYEILMTYIDAYFGCSLEAEETEKVYDAILKDVKENYFDKMELNN